MAKDDFEKVKEIFGGIGGIGDIFKVCDEELSEAEKCLATIRDINEKLKEAE